MRSELLSERVFESLRYGSQGGHVALGEGTGSWEGDGSCRKEHRGREQSKEEPPSGLHRASETVPLHIAKHIGVADPGHRSAAGGAIGEEPVGIGAGVVEHTGVDHSL